MTSSVKKERNFKVYIPMILVIGMVIAGVIYWYIEYSKYIKTDDAHVESDNVAVSAKMLGRISQLYAYEGDSVTQGELLAVLDSTDMVAQRAQAIAGKEQAEANIVQAEAKYQADQKNIKVLEITLARTQDDFNRAKDQYKGDVISKELYEHAQKALEIAQAQLDAARSQLKVSSAIVASSKAAVTTADAQVNVISTQMGNTRLLAPFTGIVGKRWLLPGDVAQPGQSIYTLVNDRNLWVSVFLEETKLKDLHLGQAVHFTLDAFPDVTFTGKIISLGTNTASLFSLIPASNASGNFTKVTQRVQLKVSIEGTLEGKSLSQYRILSGMSAVVKIVR
jgi:membrane fusion protein (multidrug efflux system)